MNIVSMRMTCGQCFSTKKPHWSSVINLLMNDFQDKKKGLLTAIDNMLAGIQNQMTFTYA